MLLCKGIMSPVDGTKLAAHLVLNVLAPYLLTLVMQVVLFFQLLQLFQHVTFVVTLLDLLEFVLKPGDSKCTLVANDNKPVHSTSVLVLAVWIFSLDCSYTTGCAQNSFEARNLPKSFSAFWKCFHASFGGLWNSSFVLTSDSNQQTGFLNLPISWEGGDNWHQILSQVFVFWGHVRFLHTCITLTPT